MNLHMIAEKIIHVASKIVHFANETKVITATGSASAVATAATGASTFFDLMERGTGIVASLIGIIATIVFVVVAIKRLKADLESKSISDALEMTKKKTAEIELEIKAKHLASLDIEDVKDDAEN